MEGMISVIVPVYNVEAYLPACVDSILRQDYANMEIILIDDGSTDGSAQICDLYAEKDKRIKAIHKENGGAASAKNAGLRIASGEYLSFVDSDDYLEPDAYRHMVSILEAHSAEVVQCSFRDVYTDETIDHVVLQERCDFSTQGYLKRYTEDWSCCLLWDKLYRRSLFDGIYFEEGHIVDDEYFTYQGIMNAKKIVHDPYIVYNYRKRISSVTIKPEYRERTIYDKLDYLEKRRTNISRVFPELKDVFDIHYLDMLVWLSRDPYVTIGCLDSIKVKIRSFLKQKGYVHIDFGRKMNLWRILLQNTGKLMQKRNPEPECNRDKLFA